MSQNSVESSENKTFNERKHDQVPEQWIVSLDCDWRRFALDLKIMEQEPFLMRHRLAAGNVVVAAVVVVAADFAAVVVAADVAAAEEDDCTRFPTRNTHQTACSATRR